MTRNLMQRRKKKKQKSQIYYKQNHDDVIWRTDNRDEHEEHTKTDTGRAAI